MTISLSCRDMLTKIRRRIHDVDSRTFDDAEILGRMDDVLRHMFSRMRLNGTSYSRDREDVPVASWSNIGQNIVEYALPEYIGDIEAVEGLQTNSDVPKPIREIGLEERTLPLGNLGMRGLGWVWSRWGNAGSIQLLGSTVGLSTIRIWHSRTLGPIHYGAFASGTATSGVIGSTTGDYKARTGLYVGQQFEVYSDTGHPTNVGAVRRITASAGGSWTFDALPAAASSTTNYALIIAAPGETMEYMAAKTADKLLGDYGADEQRAMNSQDMASLEADFEQAIQTRSSGEPPRLTSSRIYH